MLLFTKKYLQSFLFLALITSLTFGQSQPYLSAPVNGSTWELTTPTLYWWYVSTPYSVGPFNYSVQVSSSPTDFTGSNLLVDATVTSYGVGNYPISSSVGLIQGVTYYWRVGVAGTYSTVWSFAPYNYGTVTTYTITATSELNGSISPSGSLTVARGASRTFAITANSGYSIKDVLVDNISVGAVSSYTFSNITASHAIRATFLQVPKYDTTFVSILGSDTDGLGTRVKPYRKIQRGHDKAKAGDYVYVFDGVYLEDVVITKPIKICGQSTPSTRSFIVRANDVTIKNFHVSQSSPGPGIQKIGLESYDHLENLTIDHVQAYNNAELGLLLENIDNVVVKDCKFYGDDMGGITLVNCNNLTFTNVDVYDNLRGFFAFQSNNITLTNFTATDNGKAYLALFPDKNGLTLSRCNNLTLNTVTSISNDEQGIKFEDCSQINMNNVSSFNNKTDGIVFVESDQIKYNTGAVSDNGTTADDNGIEIVACDNIEFTTVVANGNFNIGINFPLYYKGIYIWDPTKPIPPIVPTPEEYKGPSNDIRFTNVTANGNGKHGFYGLHISNATITNPSFCNNVGSGFEIDAAHHIYLIGGKYDGNANGVALKPTINTHPIAPKLSTDEITNFSLTGDASMSNNTVAGIVISPVKTTKVTDPLFYGKFNVLNNGLNSLRLGGKVTNSIFSGLYFKSATASGVEIVDSSATSNVSGTKINNSYFDGYFPPAGRAAISLINNPATFTSAANVDAKNNVFVGVATDTDVENIIIHKPDLGILGLVTTTGWTNGQPAIKIGSASGYVGTLVTIPISLDISASPLSFTQLMGKITFNEHKLRYKYTTYGTGTIIHDAGWGILFDHATTDELRFMAFGFNAINTSGVLFSVTFEVADNVDGSESIYGLAADWTINGAIAPFVVYNGKITYSASSSISIMKGDATKDFVVDNSDYIAVLNHVRGITLTGQAFLNADVNKDTRVDELDAADILAYVNSTPNTWPSTSTPPLGDLSFARSTIDQNAILRFPVTLNNSSNVRSLQIEFKYDDSKVDFRNFIQLMQGKDYYVEAQTIAKGTTKLLFTSSSKSGGNLVPAELLFNIKGNVNTAGLIKSTYSINGNTAKTGPAYGSSALTDVEEQSELPSSFVVEQNYPNPFNPSTSIRYSLPAREHVTLKIYDILGRLVKTLVDTELYAGKYEAVWNGDNQSGIRVSSGTYFYQIAAGSNVVSKKMLLLK